MPIGQMVIVNGETDPDAKLWVDNKKVDVDEDGVFDADDAGQKATEAVAFQIPQAAVASLVLRRIVIALEQSKEA